jgi:hypothetical protein
MVAQQLAQPRPGTPATKIARASYAGRVTVVPTVVPSAASAPPAQPHAEENRAAPPERKKAESP